MEMTIDDLAELMIKEFARIDARFDRLEERMDRLDARMDALENRMDRLEHRMDTLEARMDAFEIRMDSLEKRVMALEELGEEHSGRFITLEDQVTNIQYTLREADLFQVKKRVQRLERTVFGDTETL